MWEFKNLRNMASKRDCDAQFNTFIYGNSNAVIGNHNKVNITKKSVDVKPTEKEVPTGVEETNQLEEQSAFVHVMQKGFVVIIHNYFFKERNDPPRRGSEHDVSGLEKLFKINFGFDVRIYENLHSDDIEKTAKDISEKDFSKFDSLFFVILSHGNEKGILGVDEKPVSPGLITSMFTCDKCPTLKDKPKVFIIQACRGSEDDFGVTVSDANPTAPPISVLQTVPIESDFLVCFSSPIGYVSYRDEEGGSWFVQELIKIFEKYADKDHLMDLMLRVNFTVSRKSCDRNFKQIPSEECRLRKKCYFNSKPN